MSLKFLDSPTPSINPSMERGFAPVVQRRLNREGLAKGQTALP
jgi:hypothetical protein